MDEYQERINKIDAVLARYLPEVPDAKWLTRMGIENTVPIAPAKNLTQPAWDLLNRGGKRWRPLLMNLVCESLGGGDTALGLSPLVEFSHNASLIHDDIEDNSDERRGKPAVHLLYGIDTGINSGSFLYFLALACIKDFDMHATTKNLIFETWAAYMRRLHMGQAMDITWHRDFDSLPRFDEYYCMCGMKTGCLARLAAVLGIIASPLPAPLQAALQTDIGPAAEKLGIGFQILDDVKNVTHGIPGKKRGDDIVEGKKSLPLLLYLYANPDKKAFAARCFTAARKTGTAAPEVEELISELSIGGFLSQAHEQGLRLINEARELFVHAFDTAGQVIDESGKQALLGLLKRIS
ncbi:polyprenyl synthetase family protein [Breznakiellaceae bacterium SP9]